MINAHMDVSVITWTPVTNAAWAEHSWSEWINGRVRSDRRLAGPLRYSLVKVKMLWMGYNRSLWRGFTDPMEKTIPENTQVKQKLKKVISRRTLRKRIETIRRMGSPMWPPKICNETNMVCSRLNSEEKGWVIGEQIKTHRQSHTFIFAVEVL